MEYNKDGRGILQRLDKLTEELQLLRREVADLLVKQAECDATPAVSHPSHEGSAEKPAISCISSLEELFALDFENPKMEVVSGDEEEANTVEPTVATVAEPTIEPSVEPQSEASIGDLFMTAGSDEAMEELFEERKHFNLLGNLSIADRYLFANELFMGDQAALTDMLADIEKLSDMSHVESYLYDVRQFGKDEEAVKHLVAFIKEHSC